MKPIPNYVKQLATANGYNSIEFICKYKGLDAYGVGIVDKNGIPEPIGMPMYILVENGVPRIVYDNDVPDLLASIE